MPHHSEHVNTRPDPFPRLMTPDDEAEVARLMREARERDRGYASFFGWQTDRDLEELGALRALAESLEARGTLFFDQISIRGRGKDPPDLEALDAENRRVAFEVTELVNGDAIKSYKAGRRYDWAEWTKEKFLEATGKLLVAKARKLPMLKDGPYPGGYVVVIFSDEPKLRKSVVEAYLEGYAFVGVPEIDRAFLILSYDPSLERCPHFELKKDA